MPRGIYRPRHAERTSLYQLFEGHFDRYALEYDERFEPRYGPLRRVVRRVVEEYLECGRPEGGFARIRCPSCRGEHLLAFSCQTRNFCPSCQAKRAALFAEHLVEDVLFYVPHRHVVFTVPKVVRGSTNCGHPSAVQTRRKPPRMTNLEGQQVLEQEGFDPACSCPFRGDAGHHLRAPIL